MPIPCTVKDLGLIDYLPALDFQKKTLNAVIQGKKSTLLLCEHPAVLTLGRLATEENFLISKEEILKKNIRIESVDRGGEVTLHSPGQLVVYPIFNLSDFGKDLRRYFHNLEEVVIGLLKDFGIEAKRNSGQTGVWVKDDKIASIGIGVKKWVSYHGLAINVDTDLKLFSMIRPCGLDVRMTSINKIIDNSTNINIIKGSILEHFKQIFNLEF